jgi:hypothetical protein
MNNVQGPSQTIARQIENINLPESLTPANIQKNLNEGIATISNNIESAKQTIGNNIETAKQTIGNTLNDFSSKSVLDASSEFLESNSIIAKCAFIILVLILFMFLLKLGIMLIGYFTQPSNNPYLVKGTISGNVSATISQDPKNDNSILIKRSNNKSKGLEFSWSIWLFLSETPKDEDKKKYQHIFNKGDLTVNTDGVFNINGPGMYLVKDETKVNIRIIMDTVTSSTPDANSFTPNTYVDVQNVPLKKWVNITFRVENKIMDVYVNGTISNRLVFENVPLQTYNDIQLCQNGGFNGQLSNLRYFNYSLNIFEINTLVLTRNPNMCNFLDYNDYKIVYKRYASLYFVTIVDKDDNELYILEIIHHYVEILD